MGQQLGQWRISANIPVDCIVDHWPLSDLPDRLTHPSRLNAKVMQGLFLLRERLRACSSRHAVGAALLLLVILPGCSGVPLVDEMPASEPDLPGYNKLVANHLKATFKNLASYDAFAISTFRRVHSFKGWVWMTCVRFEDKGHPRTYAFFIRTGRSLTAGMPFRPTPATPKRMVFSTRWGQRGPGFWGRCTRPA